MTDHDATAGPRSLPRAEAAAARAGFEPVRHVSVTGSTNADLAAEARDGDSSATILVADHQTRGRGRRDRIWVDGPGSSLLCSFRQPIESLDAHDYPACVAAATRAAVAASCPLPVLAKWPNDLVVETGAAPGKLGGILAELVAGPRDVVVIGLGLNLHPVPGQSGATSLEECGAAPDRDALLADVIDRYHAARSDPTAARLDLRENSATLGRDVVVESGAGSVRGRAVDLTADGRLILVTDSGERIVDAGDVVHLRPARGRSDD